MEQIAAPRYTSDNPRAGPGQLTDEIRKELDVDLCRVAATIDIRQSISGQIDCKDAVYRRERLYIMTPFDTACADIGCVDEHERRAVPHGPVMDALTPPPKTGRSPRYAFEHRCAGGRCFRPCGW